MIPRIYLTPGEPAGIGPDISAMIAKNSYDADIVAIADPDLLRQRSQQLGLELTIETISENSPRSRHKPGILRIIPIPTIESVISGRLIYKNARYVLKTLTTATNLCSNQPFSALVTGPVHKGIINDCGITFTGHTEFLAEQTNTEQVVMMLATERLRVALATTHMPLNRVCSTISAKLLAKIIRIIDQDIQKYYGLKNPKINICGLNPHAGEDGHLGHEDRDIIEPVIQKLNTEGLNLSGPLPADTAFIPKYLNECDVVLAMYHDQGLPVIKHAGFGLIANITLGLPFIRTSVDHGTALDLSGTGNADPRSLNYAIRTAINMCNKTG